jgi:hypothetical protein
MENKFIIYDNVLPKEKFEEIAQGIIGDNSLPWYYSENISGHGKEEVGYFAHMFYFFEDYKVKVSNWYYLVEPIVNILECKSLLRIKANFYQRTDKLHHNKNHKDYDFIHNGAIFYLNTNDGFTIINDEHWIESVENRLLIFDSSIPHRSTHCTDKQYRANINFNYF